MITSHTHRSLILFSTGFVWTVFLFLWWCYYRPVIGIDDANIYQVYMRNLAQGYGFVYQIGGEKVEGFTSLLWVLLGALFYRILPVPEWGLLITSLLLVNGLIMLLNFQLSKLFNERGLRSYHLFFCVLLLIIPGYFDWTLLPQMETALWSFLLIVLILQAANKPIKSAAPVKQDLRFSGLLVLLLLTRPESMLWAPVLLGLRVLRFRLEGWPWREIIRRNLLPTGVAILTLSALIGWRLWYFGFPFPNTYYAKVSAAHFDNAREGFLYLARFVRHQNPMLIGMIGWSLGWLYKAGRAQRLLPSEKPLAILTAVSLINLVLPLLTGGDHFFLGRVLQPLFPLTFLVFTYLIFKSEPWPFNSLKGHKRTLAVLALLLLAMLLPDQLRFYQYRTITTDLHIEYQIAQEGRKTGLQMTAFFENSGPLPVVGVICAGGFAYTYQGKTLDLLGLNNVAMAHAHAVKPTDRPKNHGSFDPVVFYAQQPDLVYPTSFLTDTTNLVLFDRQADFATDFMARALQHIHQEARFKALYVPALMSRKEQPEVLYAYFRRMYIAQLDTSRFQIRYLSR